MYSRCYMFKKGIRKNREASHIFSSLFSSDCKHGLQTLRPWTTSHSREPFADFGMWTPRQWTFGPYICDTLIFSHSSHFGRKHTLLSQSSSTKNSSLLSSITQRSSFHLWILLNTPNVLWLLKKTSPIFIYLVQKTLESSSVHELIKNIKWS